MCAAVRDLVVNVALDDDRDLALMREVPSRVALARARVALDAY